MRAVLVAAMLWLAAGASAGQDLRPGTAQELRSRYLALQPQLEHNAFRGPVYIESSETPSGTRGDVYAVLAEPFGTVSTALADPAHWCDVLMLHLNTKSCRVHSGGGGAVQLEMRIGKSYDQPVAAAPRMMFGWRALPPAPDFLGVQLNAADGPYDTHDYRILLEAMPLDGDGSFLHLGYSFQYGGAGRLALHLYLATIGRSKVGFTTLATGPGAAPEPIGGMRGLVERNAMRYHLAIEAYLGSLSAPADAQPDKRLQAWFDSTEKYPRQLHEVDRATYLEMKRQEIRRRQQ